MKRDLPSTDLPSTDLPSADLPPKPSRTTTKRLVIGNNLAAWVAFIAVAVLAPAAMGDVAWPLAFIIVGIVGWYTGTGSFDLRVLSQLAEARGQLAPTSSEPEEPR